MSSVAKFWSKQDPLNRLLGRHNGLNNFLNPGGRVINNVAEGKPLTFRSLADPAGVVLQAPPKAPPPPTVFPDVEGAALAARRRVRQKAAGGGLQSTILTGGYSPTGQAASPLGGA